MGRRHAATTHMEETQMKRLVGLVIMGSLVLAACTSGGGATPSADSSPAGSPAASPDMSPAASPAGGPTIDAIKSAG